MTVPTSRASARELVRRITRDHGFVSPERFEQLETFDPELRREVEEALLTKDKLIGSSVLTLATNLYTSKARFVFELLQNADDNTYDQAKASGKSPYLSFRVHHDRIVVECNEDGFTDKNLAAICAIGKSSKTAAQGYIGEKGIGFKSVFMAASKVHIQSGMLSFSFKHKSGDSGMGMISPLWEDTDESEVPLPFTRITLHLNDDGDSEQLEKARQSIHAQFQDLQETMLLFMKNLQQIHVVFYDDVSQEMSSSVYSIERPRDNYAILKRIRTTNGTDTTRIKRYHVTTFEATGLAKNENRTYSESEERAKAYAKSQVVLAFPLSESHTPIIEPQDLFVFLPVRPVGFNFLIQADFVTDANRQDVVQDSLRNVQLIRAVADAFIKAVLQFCAHDSLRFQWVGYLPESPPAKKDTSETPIKQWSGLWLQLVKNIDSQMQATPLFYNQHSNLRRALKGVCRLTIDTLDDEDNPLFEEDAQGRIVSQQYSDSDLDVLTTYGLEWCGFNDVLRWVTQDLERGDSSRIRSPKTPPSWHSRVAQLLNNAFKHKYWVCADFKRLSMIPVADSRWVSCGQTSVYFKTTNGLEIPSGIDLKLLASDTVDAHRQTLYKNLGVKSAPIDLVRKSILQFYTVKRGELDFDTSLQHLTFLYSTQEQRADYLSHNEVQLLSQRGLVRAPAKMYMYIANESNGASELFEPKPEIGAPGLAVDFVHHGYLEKPPSGTSRDTWIDWFYDELQVERHLPLHDDRELLRYIMRYRPEKLLGTFYGFYQGEKDEYQATHTELNGESDVLCRGNRKIAFKDTHFPTSDRVALTDKFLGDDVFFPWLQLEFDNDSNHIPPTWKSMLDLLSVPTDHTDVEFALGMLQYLMDAFNSEVVAFDSAKLFELYDYIQGRCWESDNRTEETQRIKTFFSMNPYIYIPGTELAWTVPEQCVWAAPQELATKHVLKTLYGQCFCRQGHDCPYFSHFFTESPGVPTACTWQDYVDELEQLKQECDDFDTITGIYQAINAIRMKVEDKEALREAFETKALIYACVDDQGAWYKPSQCVWSKSSRLRGKVSLDEDYEKLERLFIKVLGVKQVDLQMAIDELLNTASESKASVPGVKEVIMTVNSLLANETSPPSPSEVLKSPIFPVRHPSGEVTLEKSATEFFLVDREQWGESFASKVKLLDFSLREVAQLHHFLDWLGLQDRFLSHCIKEVTSFPGQGATLISTPSLQIRYKAHAVLRVAFHFDSCRTKSAKDVRRLYAALQNAEIFASDDISSNLQLSQDGKSHQVESSRSTLHIDESDSVLRVYIPRERHDQQYVFFNKLARSLFEWMVTDPATRIQDTIRKDGVEATRSILLAPHSKLIEALEDGGIATIDVENTDEALTELEPPASEPDSAPETPRDPIAFSVPYRPVRTVSSIEGSLPRSTAPSFKPPTPARDSTTDIQYVATLSRVIRAGRTDSLTMKGAPNARRSLDFRQDTADLGLRSSNQHERDCKVGAAGELYVFELLSHLCGGQGLPALTRINWKSNIRKYVTVHPEYADMEDWRGWETSDITYWDVQSALTDELIEKGHLARDIWEGKRPSYYIEVKTTTGSCDTPFYMSKAQYKRMQEYTNGSDHANGNIYVIFRVYYLGQDDMGLEIYVDPEALRREDRLEFRTETWSVVPGPDLEL